MLKPLTKISLLGVLFISITANALPSDAKQPVMLKADNATFNEKTGITEYTGNVKISQGSLVIKASRLTITLNKDNSIQSALAIGSPASMQQKVSKKKGFAKGQANKISYNAQNGIIHLLGNAKLTQDGTRIKGHEIRYSLKAGDFKAKGNKKGQIELVIPPNPNTKRLSIK